MTAHLVQFSTGLASAEVAFMVTERAGIGDDVVLLTADTRVEDEDNWRFAVEVVGQLMALRPITWLVLCDGRTPMQVGRDRRCVPNNRMAVCSQILKIQLLRAHIDTEHDPADSVVYLGFDWTEPTRIAAARPNWEPTWTLAMPLAEDDAPAKWELADRSLARGIKPPRLYDVGFGHANCGGACVRGGQEPWRRLLHWNRPRYLEWEAEEEVSRAMLGKDVSILRDRRKGRPKDTIALSLREFRGRLEADASLFDAEDVGACGCT